MTNVAQMVNVLQSVILTEGEKMVLTPTYHVFNMYKNHQDAELVESYIETENIGIEEENKVESDITNKEEHEDEENPLDEGISGIAIFHRKPAICKPDLSFTTNHN